MKKGFTLIELLVVVLIIGILAAIALPQYQKTVLKARATQIMVDIDALSKALDIYILANGYPSEETYNIPLDIELSTPPTYWCNSDMCQIEIYGAAGTTMSQIYASRESGDKSWSKRCVYASCEEPKSKLLCDSLQGFGYSSSDNCD